MTKLKSAEAKFQNISIVNDLTQEERNKIKIKMTEAKQKEEQESEGGRYVFRVRGPPWALKIVKLKSRTLD